MHGKFHVRTRGTRTELEYSSKGASALAEAASLHQGRCPRAVRRRCRAVRWGEPGAAAASPLHQ